MAKHERTRLLQILAIIFSVVVIAILAWRHARCVHWVCIVGIAGVWGGTGIALRTHQKTWGKELRYVDWWSVPHFLSGVLLAMFGIGVAWVAALAIAWELIEITAAVDEYPTNRVVDVVLALAGWLLVNAIVGGGFPVV
jgi:hypothetical protein